jgi:cell division protein ZapB
MNFFNYSGYMEADLRSLEEKISKLITLCSNLREENTLLRSTLSNTQQGADALKTKMQQASNKLELLLAKMPMPPENLNAESE